MNAKIFERFRTACDKFFTAKTEYFKATREAFAANLAAKTALCEKAEALKDSTDWQATANKLVALQKCTPSARPPRTVGSQVLRLRRRGG